MNQAINTTSGAPELKDYYDSDIAKQALKRRRKKAMDSYNLNLDSTKDENKTDQ